MLTIMIPTMNRSEFLIRQLEYYAAAGYPYEVAVADSSNEQHRRNIEDAVGRLKGRLKVTYHHLPGISDYVCLKHLVDTASTKYAVYCGDDDFFVVPGLLKAVDFLEHNSSYSAVNGRSVLVVSQEPGPAAKLTALGPYPQRALEDDTASQRLLRYTKNYFTSIFAVQRIERWRRMYAQVHTVSDRQLGGETLPCSLCAILGKIKHLDNLYLVRQAHDNRYLLLDLFDWVTKHDWASSYQIVHDILVENLMREDGLEKPAAHEVVKQALWSHWQQAMSSQYKQRYGKSVLEQAKDLLKGSEFLRRTLVPKLRQLKAKLRVKKEISLAAFLNPQSPYHEDFMPIYKKINSAEVCAP